MSILSKIDDFFAPKSHDGGGAAAAAAAAADIPLYVKGLITRPERAGDLIQHVKKFITLPKEKQVEEMIPLYLALESFIIKNEVLKKYTKESLRLDVYSRLNLKNATAPFVGFFTPEKEGLFLLMKELFGIWAAPAFDAVGKKRVGEIILSTVKGTVFERIKYEDGALEFSDVRAQFKQKHPTQDEIKSVLHNLNDAVARPVKELHGYNPHVHTIRKNIIDEWLLLGQPKKLAWQEQKAIIPITKEAREMILDVGIAEVLSRGMVSGVEAELSLKEGSTKPVSVSASALKDESGNIGGIVIMAKDLSEIQRLESEKVRILEHAKEEAEADVAQRTQELEKSKADLEKSLSTEKASTQQLKASQQQLSAANQQLTSAQKNLQDKLLELERFNKVAVGRELKMVELKREIENLKASHHS
jgi:hypothetical protein